MTQFFLENAANNMLNLMKDAVKNDDFATMGALRDDLLFAFTTHKEFSSSTEDDAAILQAIIQQAITLVIEMKPISEGMAQTIGNLIACLSRHTQDAAATLINKHNADINFSNLQMNEYAAFNGDLQKWLEESTVPEAKALLNCDRLKSDRNKQSFQPH